MAGGLDTEFRSEQRTDAASESATAPPDPLLSADSDREPVVSVVMPTLNEEAGVAECIEGVTRALRELGLTGEVIVSDS